MYVCVCVCVCVQVARAGRFGTKGLAITFVSSDEDAQVLNDVQGRFEVNITELPEQIERSLYSTCVGMRGEHPLPKRSANTPAFLCLCSGGGCGGRVNGTPAGPLPPAPPLLTCPVNLRRLWLQSKAAECVVFSTAFGGREGEVGDQRAGRSRVTM